MDGWMDGWMDVCLYVYSDGSIDGCVNGWVDKWRPLGEGAALNKGVKVPASVSSLAGLAGGSACS